jgi:FMN-dependent NADH-azoreductase
VRSHEFATRYQCERTPHAFDHPLSYTRFAAGWSSRLSGAEILVRDIGVDPPPAVDEKWIRAAFAEPRERTAEMQQSMVLSEVLIDQLFKAEVVVLGAPMYDFERPGQLKAYVDQLVRVGRTFTFNPSAAEPYRPLLEPKSVVVIISAGDRSVHPGGALAHLNFLEPHLQIHRIDGSYLCASRL